MDYRNNIGVILINHERDPFQVSMDNAIAQAVFHKYETVEFVKVSSKEDLSMTERGLNGFGSTSNKK